MFIPFFNNITLRFHTIVLIIAALLSIVFDSLYFQNLNKIKSGQKEILANYLCKIIEPRLQIGAIRDVQDFLIATTKALDNNLTPYLSIQQEGKINPVGPLVLDEENIFSCSFSGLKNISVEFRFKNEKTQHTKIVIIYFSTFLFLYFVFVFLLILIHKIQAFSVSFLEVWLFKELGNEEKEMKRIGPLSLWLLNSLKIKSSLAEEFKVEFSELKKTVEAQKKQLADNVKLNTIMETAKQVSHDIRSPLSALNMIIGQLQNHIPEQQRLTLRNSVNRINDIANTLLTKAKEQKVQLTTSTKTGSSETSSKLQVELLPALVDTIISEKRVQFRDRIGVEIEADFLDSYGAFAYINSAELSRVISNLTNNAIEAFPEGKGKFTLAVRNYKDTVAIIAKDNGKGIPEQILKRLGEMGISHGKENTQSGSGLGVYHAKKTIENFGGKLDIHSIEGFGTTITMTLPSTPAPKWFVDKLVLLPDSQIVSLDDDLSIHGIWKGRFQSLKTGEHKIEHLTFTSGPEFKDWLRTSENAIDTTKLKTKRLYLVDYELLNQKNTGLEIIEELGIGPQSILVTSRYEEPQIREKCEKLDVSLIPKGMAGLVPIEIKRPKEFYNCVLLDDDGLVEMTWKMAAEAQNKKLIYFSHPDDFMKKAKDIDFNSPLYIDSNLRNGIKGEDVAKQAFDMGFKSIYLCTGYDPNDFPPMSWIVKVIGKDPYFL